MHRLRHVDARTELLRRERIGELLPVAQRNRRKQPPATPAAQVNTAALDAATKQAFDERPLAPPKPDKHA